MKKRVKRPSRWTPSSVRSLLAPLIAALALCAFGAFNEQVLAQTDKDRVQIKGWTEVNSDWPLKAEEFFVAVAKGHHFIELKLHQLPERGDLQVHLEYYYKYQKVRPVLQMVPCKSNVDVITNEKKQSPGKWLVHNMRVKLSDCLNRKELAYNVLLHDANDVFAWRFIKIESVNGDSSDQQETSSTEATLESTTPLSELTSPPETTTPQPETTPSIPQPKPEVTSPPPETTPTSVLEPDTSTPAQETTTPLAPVTEKSVSGGPDSGPTSAPDQDKPTDAEPEIATRGPQERFLGDLPSESQVSQISRFRRWARNSEDLSLICRPSSCDRSLFHTPRFIPLVKGLPALPDSLAQIKKLGSSHKFYLNTDNKQLDILSESNTDFGEVNTCLKFELYMDADTELEFLLEDSEEQTSESKSRLLETVRRKASDSSAGGWEVFQRCISDYMPRIKFADKNPDGHHSVRFSFVPKTQGGASAAAKQIAIVAKEAEFVNLKAPYPLAPYLPNVRDLETVEQVTNFWVIDKDGVKKPHVHFEFQQAAGMETEPSTSRAPVETRRVLKVSRIDGRQESFDLTSRWIKVNNLEVLEQPVFFNYRADRADWIESVLFEYQSAKREGWVTHRLYVEFNPIGQTLRVKFIFDLGPERALMTNAETSHAHEFFSESRFPMDTDAPSGGHSSTDRTITEAPAQVETSPGLTDNTEAPRPAETSTALAVSTEPTRVVPQRGQLITPIRLKGLSSDEFRVRVRHILTREARNSGADLELQVSTLALGDACADQAFCLNGGQCRPTGAASAECSCKRGFSGRHCELVRPCEVLYDGKTGAELCKLAGAECVTELPVFRCRWPNDQFFQCRALYQRDNDTGQLVPAPPFSEASLSPESVEERANEQTRLVIILSVFLAAMTLFSVVIIVNMLNRLMESKRRLRLAESQAHELARRTQPGTSNSANAPPSFGRLSAGRHKAPAALSYNNQAFDVE